MSIDINIPFGDLKRHYASMKAEIDDAIARTLTSGMFILGSRLEEFENRFSDYCDSRFCVGVGSGTEALHLALKALDIGPGDEVITVANTCVPTVSAISSVMAQIVLTDVDDMSMTMDHHDLRRKITSKTKAIIPVHLYGQAADLDAIHQIASDNGLYVVEDAAQAHGTKYRGKRIGSLSTLSCFSFYPSKNLGAFGDGGAVTTNDEGLAAKLRMIRNYGQRVRYHHDLKGINSRLDELQAAILTVKLARLDSLNARRREIAVRYAKGIINPLIRLPKEMEYGVHNYHLYVVRTSEREALQTHLERCGVGTIIHYPVPIHLQRAYADLGNRAGDFPVTEALSKEVVSLPLFPELTEREIDHIIQAVNRFRG